MENKFNIWDKFVGHMILCVASAEEKYKYFIIDNVDGNDIYDLFFFRIAYISSTFAKNCNVYCFSRKLFGFIKFKFKEQKARSIPMRVINLMPNKNIHICSKTERTDLLEEVAARYDLALEDIKDIYREYYAR